ncbi:MAG: FKBP-type peptidyl-prolyl cis-trans isomerase [Bacteroidaceae bacterium]|nr:FKBP-type peptidyl-prolyl cis-trans isomerase [Bacteroidaceae bacterium]MCI6744275.1 FKBP-type peptidyl-prolyl cis-trans isomerase [Paraprevotella sp.]MCI7081296.1 FKBP-type peptidyl-prolyl cis-trans isomerase [Paraprevotella sp.]MCI7746863.1 FKBP-type peptidyl-prolyl cis-trans isomerase [Paraprevotella sp.]MDD5970525.1 FKBP-type peptidyl-prolyl cis-trans isomerase [Paraprevotella sp.]
MKKISILAVAAIAAAMVSCGNGTPKADIKTDIDTLSYAVGMAQTRGLKEYLVQRMGMDTAYIDDFVKGLNESVNAGDDKKKAAYYAGLQIGQQISQQMIKGLNYELFGEDSTQTVSLNNFMAGFVAATTGKGELMTLDSAAVLAETMMVTIKDKQINERYADNKVASEKFMAEIAKKEGIQTLGDGIYYEVITEGKGEIPADTDRVKVDYEGTLINDSVFDSSYKRGEPTTFMCKQVIPGWTKALTHMPVGSTWKVYIPQEQAYGSQDRGMIKPFSALVFKIELHSIEK